MSHPEQIDNLVVAKVGSSTLVDENGAPDRAFIRSLCDQAADLVSEGYRVVIVSSGAAAAGMERLGFSERPDDMPSLQACCAAGQAALTEIYAEALGERGIPCGQVLITRGDVVSRDGYLNARNTFDRLLEMGVVPVVNENDTVSFSEFNFGDNDMLGAIVSTLVGAGLYVILSDVDGLHTADPSVDPGAQLVERVERIDHAVVSMAGGAGSKIGTGGMASKIRAARALLAAGIPMVICEGRRENVLVDVVRGQRVGTRFEAPAGSSHESARKLWIGLAGFSRGVLTVDAGAQRALVEDGASLLPVGVTATSGSYGVGDVVSVISEDGELLGRGVVRYSSKEMEQVHGLKLDVVARFMPDRTDQPCIHRDELLVF